MPRGSIQPIFQVHQRTMKSRIERPIRTVSARTMRRVSPLWSRTSWIMAEARLSTIMKKMHANSFSELVRMAILGELERMPSPSEAT